jgi:hypothetical protein
VGTDLDSDNIYCLSNENSGNSMISILAGANDLFTPEDIRKKEISLKIQDIARFNLKFL